MADVFISWSGGKDCCLSAYRAIRDGHNIRYLASIITNNTGRLWPHLLTPEVLNMQAQAMGIPLLEWDTDISNYNSEYIKMLQYLKGKGVNHGVFGDVSIGNAQANEHKSWIDSVCVPNGIVSHLPLWDETRESLWRDLLESGFEAIIIAVDNDKLGKDYLGQRLDKNLLSELKVRHQLSPTGEVGYYHTFVVDGPIFSHRLKLVKAEPIQYAVPKDVWYLDIQECKLEKKESYSPSLKISQY